MLLRRSARCLMSPPPFAPSSRAALAALLTAALALGAAAPVRATLEPPGEAEVRRWEYVVVVRVSREIASPIGKVETATLRAGGAVLERVRDESGPLHVDHRMLVRTRDPSAIHEVLREVRAVAGVLGASTAQLPETPTYAGGPDFISSYTGDFGANPGDPRVVVRHDVPPVLDKRDLLENAPIPAGPTVGNTGTGGFTLNVSELFARLKESSWRKREQRMKDGYLPILPPERGGADATAAAR
jgi:hypothetical protein